MNLMNSAADVSNLNREKQVFECKVDWLIRARRARGRGLSHPCGKRLSVWVERHPDNSQEVPEAVLMLIHLCLELFFNHEKTL